MRLLHSRIPTLIQSRVFEEDGIENSSSRETKEREGAKTRLAFVADLEKMPEMGNGSSVWAEAVKRETLDEAWLCKAAALSDLAVLLSTDASKIAAAAVKIRLFAAELRKAKPFVLGGPFLAVDPGMDFLATYVDGIVLKSQNEDEAEIEAERLRRTASMLAEVLMIERGTWKESPLLCLWAPADVLAVLPQGCCEWMMMETPPEKPFAQWAKKLVLTQSEDPTWWVNDYSTVGPDLVWWRAWMRDPKSSPV